MEDCVVITRLCKDDIREIYAGDEAALEFIDKLDEADLEYIAEKMANVYLESLYWISLKTIVDELMGSKKEV